MIIKNDEVFINEDDFTLNRISVKDFILDDFRDYYGNIVYDGDNELAERFSIDWSLLSTDNLIFLADKLRSSKGLLPMLPDKNSEELYDMDGWYNFYFAIEGDVTESDTVTNINYEFWFFVSSDIAEDAGKCYQIVLSDAAMEDVVGWLESYDDINFEEFMNDNYIEYK